MLHICVSVREWDGFFCANGYFHTSEKSVCVRSVLVLLLLLLLLPILVSLLLLLLLLLLLSKIEFGAEFSSLSRWHVIVHY